MNFKYHGNYCGPGWTDNSYKDAKDGIFNLEPSDKFDSICKEHDQLYKEGRFLEADNLFISQDPSSFKHYLAQKAIYLQSKLRELGIMAKGKNGKKKAKVAQAKKELKSINKTIAKVSKPRTMNPPTAYGSSKTLMKSHTKLVKGSIFDSNKPVVISGKQFLGNISVSSSSAVGSTLLTQSIAPQNFTNGRLNVLSTLFEKYRVTHCKAVYTPQVGTTMPGQFFMYFDYDVSDDDSTGMDNVEKASNSASSVDTVIWKGVTLNLSQKLRQTSFFTSIGVDPRNEVQAVLKIVSNSVFSGNLTLGSIVLHYTIEFYGGEFQPGNGATSKFTNAIHTDSIETADPTQLVNYLNVATNMGTNTIESSYSIDHFLENNGQKFQVPRNYLRHQITNDEHRFFSYNYFEPGVYQVSLTFNIDATLSDDPHFKTHNPKTQMPDSTKCYFLSDNHTSANYGGSRKLYSGTLIVLENMWTNFEFEFSDLATYLATIDLKLARISSSLQQYYNLFINGSNPYVEKDETKDLLESIRSLTERLAALETKAKTYEANTPKVPMKTQRT